jgi:Protein of unknown function (DUF3168)
VSAGLIAKALLNADATTQSLIGSAVYPGVAPQDAVAPYVTYEDFDGTRYPSMGSDADICDSRLRLHCWHQGYPDALAIANACRKALQRFKGTAGGYTVDDIFTEPGGPSLYDEPTRTHHLVRDFRVIFRET